MIGGRCGISLRSFGYPRRVPQDDDGFFRVTVSFYTLVLSSAGSTVAAQTLKIRRLWFEPLGEILDRLLD